MEYIKKIGNFLKKGNVDDLLKRNSLLFVIFGCLYLFSYAFLHDYKTLTVGSIYLSIFLLFAFYFKWVKTNGGKTNFYIANAIASLLILLFAVLLFISTLGYLDFDYNALGAFGSLLLVLTVLGVAIYLGLVFLLRKKTNAKVFKGNVNTYFFYSILGLDVVQLLLNTFVALSNVMDAGEAILYIFNFAIMVYTEYVLIKYVYFYQEHKTGKSLKTCTNCGFKVDNNVETCPECGKTEFITKEEVKNVFTEIEEYHKNKKKTDLSTAFQVDNLPNGSVGSKIKTYARVGMKILVVILFFAIIGSFVIAGSVADMNTSYYLNISSGYSYHYDIWEALLSYIVTLLIVYASILVIYVIMYFNFLLLTGFGAIIEDVNAIKNKK